MSYIFWKNKKVFVTGHTGFKGSWLSLWLHSLGADVTGFSIDVPTSPSLFEEANIKEKITSIEGDITDLESLKAALTNSCPDIVLHLAAQSLVRESYDHPVNTYATNVMGTVNLLEAVRHTLSVKSVVVVTSDKCYDNKEWTWGYRENEPMGGFDPYSNSKGCSELVTSAYRNSFFANEGSALIASGRAGNVIGGGDWAKDRLIPDTVKSFTERQTVNIRSPKAIRPWQHVLEPLRGYMMLAEELYNGNKEFAQGWNFGPVENDIRSVSWIVEKLVSIWGNGANWKMENADQPHEAKLLALDHSLARYKLGWEPILRLEDALEWVVDWYKAFESNEDIYKTCMTQIKNYQDLEGL